MEYQLYTSLYFYLDAPANLLTLFAVILWVHDDKCKQRGFFKRIIAFLLYRILSNSGLYPIELIFLLCSYCVLRFYVVWWDSFIVWLVYSTFSRFSSAKHVSALLYVPWTGTYIVNMNTANKIYPISRTCHFLKVSSVCRTCHFSKGCSALIAQQQLPLNKRLLLKRGGCHLS